MSTAAATSQRGIGFQPMTKPPAPRATNLSNAGIEMLEAAREVGLPVNAEDAHPPSYTLVEIHDGTHWFDGWVDGDGAWWIDSANTTVKHGLRISRSIRCHDDMITAWRPKPCGN